MCSDESRVSFWWPIAVVRARRSPRMRQGYSRTARVWKSWHPLRRHGLAVIDGVEEKLERPVRLRTVGDLRPKQQNAPATELRVHDGGSAIEKRLTQSPSAAQWRAIHEPGHTSSGGIVFHAEDRTVIEEDIDVRPEAVPERGCVVHADPQHRPRHVERFARQRPLCPVALDGAQMIRDRQSERRAD